MIGLYDSISSVGFPGFNIGMIMAFVQSAGRLILLVQNLLHARSSVSVAFEPRFLINSGNILSGPGCFLSLMFFVASFNSSIVNSFVNRSVRWPSPLFTPYCFLCIFSFFLLVWFSFVLCKVKDVELACNFRFIHHLFVFDLPGLALLCALFIM